MSMTIKEIAAAAGKSVRQLGIELGIPRRTIEAWSSGDRQPLDYVINMIEDRYVHSVPANVFDVVNEKISRAARSGNRLAATWRRGTNGTMADSPALYPLLYEGMPEALLGSDDEPSGSEQAVFLAMSLWGYAQFAIAKPMHQRGISIGEALRRVPNLDTDRAIKRLGRVYEDLSWDFIQTDLKWLIYQLREHEIPMDYAMLAEQLLSISQSNELAESIFHGWLVDFMEIEEPV